MQVTNTIQNITYKFQFIQQSKTAACMIAGGRATFRHLISALYRNIIQLDKLEFDEENEYEKQ